MLGGYFVLNETNGCKYLKFWGICYQLGHGKLINFQIKYQANANTLTIGIKFAQLVLNFNTNTNDKFLTIDFNFLPTNTNIGLVFSDCTLTSLKWQIACEYCSIVVGRRIVTIKGKAMNFLGLNFSLQIVLRKVRYEGHEHK